MKTLWIGLLILFVLLFIIFYLAHKNRRLKKEISKNPRRKIIELFAPRFNKRKSKKLKKLIDEHQKKRKDRERAELFGLFDFKELKKRSYVDLLDKIARHHHIKKRIKSKEIKANSTTVESLVREMKGKEAKIEDLSEKEAKDVFDILRNKISGTRKR